MEKRNNVSPWRGRKEQCWEMREGRRRKRIYRCRYAWDVRRSLNFRSMSLASMLYAAVRHLNRNITRSSTHGVVDLCSLEATKQCTPACGSIRLPHRSMQSLTSPVCSLMWKTSYTVPIARAARKLDSSDLSLGTLLTFAVAAQAGPLC